MNRQKRRQLRELLVRALKDSPSGQEFLRILRGLPEQAKGGIVSGKYERQDFVDAISTDDMLDRIASDALASCSGAGISRETIDSEVEPGIRALLEEARSTQYGPKYGLAYGAVLAKLIPECLGRVVNQATVRVEARASGGWIDFVMPLRLAVLGEYPLWQAWRDDYAIRKIIVEAKSLRTRAGSDDVGQVIRYQETADLGRCAFLVSRNGFTSGAMGQLRKFARGRERLILPFAEEDLHDLSEASIAGDVCCMDYLNDRQLALASA